MKIRDWQLRIGKINSYYLYGTASPPLKKKTVVRSSGYEKFIL
jgi:hypothetical protein